MLRQLLLLPLLLPAVLLVWGPEQMNRWQRDEQRTTAETVSGCETSRQAGVHLFCVIQGGVHKKQAAAAFRPLLALLLPALHLVWGPEQMMNRGGRGKWQQDE
jgi:hypothetical protein